MSSNESSSVPARLKDLKDSVKERFLGLLGIRQPKVLLEDDQEVFLQVGRTVWHAPRQLRIELWLSSLARRHSLVSEYQTYLSQDITREAAVDIEKDVQRTFPNTRRFHAEEGQAQLRNVLRAYAAYDPEVAYCQGMNFLTGLLLMYMPSEAHAFAALVVLMEDRKLRSFYHRSMSLLQVQLWQLSRLVAPALNQHLETLGVVPMLYGASWLMTAFSADFPIPFSARIMDVLLADQCECALLKVATAIMKAVEPRLLAMSDLEDVLGHLKIEVPGWDEQDLHDLLTAAFTKPWTSRQLAILRSTEGAETVAQAMDRVMTMNEQLNVQGGDDEEGGDDGEVVDGRVAVTIPRLQPPPQAHSSFSASPACGTPVNGGIHGTGSIGGAVGSPPLAAAAPISKCSSLGGSSSAGGATAASSSAGAGGGTSSGGGGLLMLQGPATSGGSPAVWGIPCIHPNVPASPAIQAFRRAHLPVFQAAVAAGAGAALGRNSGASDSQLPQCCPSVKGDAAADADRELRSSSTTAPAAVGDADALLQETAAAAGAVATAEDCSCEAGGNGGGSGTEWGEFNSAVVRQKWRNIIMRAAPGSTRHVLLHSADELTGEEQSPWQASAVGRGSACGPNSATAAQQQSSLGAGVTSQPIPVPGALLPCCRSGSLGSASAASAFAAPGAAAAAAAASGKPPLPPRTCTERTTPILGSYSRLSVVAEDPIAVQVGAVAPAPSPRGSMDLHVLGRSGSQHLDGCEHPGAMLFSGNSFCNAGGSALVMGSASCNGDWASGTASATTAGALLSPSGASGALSPHPVSSPRVPSGAGWGTSAAGGGGGGGGTGSDTPTTGYVPIGMERAGSGSLFDGVGLLGASFLDRSFSMVTPLLPPLVVPPAPLQAPQQPSGAAPAQGEAAATHDEAQPIDMATDIAGDILRMLSAVDTGNANAAYDPRTVLGESMYADSPNKEEHKLVRKGSENMRHQPSSSVLAELAAQDLAKAQEEAERVRLELEAQLVQQRAAERASGSQPSTGGAPAAGTVLDITSAGASSAVEGGPPGSRTSAGETHGTVDSGAEDGVATRPSGTGDAPAGSAGAEAGPSGVAGGGGGGGDELVFRRPTLYVDGIPMFDPKSLMNDSHEAQVMFTPTVSPGASSYADPLLSGFTPTGDAAASAAEGHDADATAAATATTVSGIEGVCDGTDGYTVTQTEEGTCPADDCDDTAAQDPAAVYNADSAVDVNKDALVTAAAAADLPRAAGSLPHSQSASEWVDWSQAPPIQAIQPVVIAVSEATDTAGSLHGMSVSASAPDAVPAAHTHLSAGVSHGRFLVAGDDGGAAAAAAASEMPQVLATMSSADLTRRSPRTCTVTDASGGGVGGATEQDLIELTSPARPLHSCAAALRDGLSLPASLTSGTGTGLSPVPLQQPQAHRQQLSATAPPSLSERPQASSASETLPYGLLSADSNLSLCPPAAPCISFASSTTASLYGNSFTGGNRPGLSLPTHPAINSESSSTSSSGAPGSGLTTQGRSTLLTTAAVATAVACSTASGLTAAQHLGSEDVEGNLGVSSANGDVGNRDSAFSAEPHGNARRSDAPGAAEDAAELPPRVDIQPEEQPMAEAAAVSAPAPARGAFVGAGVDDLHLPDPLGGLSGLAEEVSAEAAASFGRGRSGDGGLGGGTCTPPTIEPQGSYELGTGLELGEVESSPYQAALSPSLAYHIMSAYLRSEQHQQQQEQREMAERLQLELQQQHQEHLLASTRVGTTAEALTEVPVAALVPITASGAAAEAISSPQRGVETAAVGCTTGTGLVSSHSAAHHSLHPAAPAPLGVEELSLFTPMPTMASGLMSPAAGSPGRTAGVGGLGSVLMVDHLGEPGTRGGAAAAAACTQVAKALTPFAVSLDDPSSCRISAEVLQALPPPLILQPPETPTPPFPLAASGSGLTAAAECRTLQASGRGSRRCTGSGDCDISVSASGLGCVGVSGLGGVAGNSNIGHIACLARPSGGGAAPSAGAASHDGLGLTLGGVPSGHLSGVNSATTPPVPGAGSGVCSYLSLQPHLQATCSSMGFSGSSGGAVPPLLPPPPPPQVPLCQTTAAASAVRLESTSAPVVPPSSAATAPPQTLPPVLCSSSATVLCVNALAASTALAATATPVTGTAAAPPLPAPPSWTATFDVVDDSPSGIIDIADTASRPRTLSSVFAAGPPAGVSPNASSSSRECGGGARGLSTTGISTPEARLHTPDMARGMSIETATQLPPPPPAAAFSRPQQPLDLNYISSGLL